MTDRMSDEEFGAYLITQAEPREAMARDASARALFGMSYVELQERLRASATLPLP